MKIESTYYSKENLQFEFEINYFLFTAEQVPYIQNASLNFTVFTNIERGLECFDRVNEDSIEIFDANGNEVTLSNDDFKLLIEKINEEEIFINETLW